MKAWQVTRLGEPTEVLRWNDVPPPEGELRIEVEAVALNFPDVLLCRGEYQDKPELPFTPGAEVCGRIVDGPRAGERVLAAPEL
ncbi:MAG: alcohol dehydrogenase catalytic domain-containing protein, partial [Actinoplanes sp.]